MSARAGDTLLLARLHSLGCSLDEVLRGGARTLDIALASGAVDTARFLLDRKVSANGALLFGAGVVDPQLAKELLARGAHVDEHAVFAAIDAGNLDTALVLLSALDRSLKSLQLAIRARQRAADAEQTAKRIESESLVSNATPSEYRDRAQRLNAFADRFDPTLPR